MLTLYTECVDEWILEAVMPVYISHFTVLQPAEEQINRCASVGPLIKWLGEEKLDPVGSTVRYEMMNLCTVSV